MRTTFSNLAILASSLLVKEVFAAPVQERATYIDTDIVMVTEEVTVTEMPDGSYETGAPVAIGTGILTGTPVLFSEASSATPIATPTSSAVEIPATTSSAMSTSSSSSSTGAVFIQNTHVSDIHTASSSSTPIVVAPTSTSVAPVVTPTTLSTKASTTPVPTTSKTTSSVAVATTASSSSKKRGLAFNDASLTDAFSSSSEVSWAYNWASSTSDAIASGLEYIPMLWGLGSDNTDGWSSIATKAIAAGSTALLGFNEPDYSGQSDLTYSQAATGWQTFMEPFAGKATLVSPAVTNGGSPMGLTWLENFISACTSCTIDAVAIHWYNGGTAADFQSYVQQAYTAGGNRPLWITEFQASGTTDEQNSFLEEVIPFLDGSDMVAKYAYFMASDGILLTSGTTLSTLGETFASFV
ncbi:uncharacterized protein LY89DRAFT_599598 [Mollisia scopiformis]|uniref:Asl1-like glycosyl hydrolase catalytic domain-containing protein n=1 Tax=Mollisia scopiformis TaxID=149040 RepID=A0A132B7W9_MOLSC|nr:uncharacterized protein LY89DRAFT_599598 [Mollisia scopiformis]KUJ08495.1 hypothetical protein LY89DRAFT_599598 [Mollisia scopiformis]